MKHLNCTHCGKPIVLVPSANERAKKWGKTAKFYRDLFTIHSDCLLEIRDGKSKETK